MELKKLKKQFDSILMEVSPTEKRSNVKLMSKGLTITEICKGIDRLLEEKLRKKEGI